MKKKFILTLGICFLSFSLFGCSKENQSNISEEQSETEITIEETGENSEILDVVLEEMEEGEASITPIPKDELNNEEYIFYACLSIYMEDFDRNYTLAGQAIDDNDLNDFHYYLEKIQKNIEDIESLKTPDTMKQAKVQIINSLNSYKNAAILLNSAYKDVDYYGYGDFFKEIDNAQNFAVNFSIYCENFESYITYLSSIMETSFYMSNYKLYSMSNMFTDEENKILYTLNHNMLLLPNLIDDAFIKYQKGETINEIAEIRNIANNFDVLEISDENLDNFRKELSESLIVFADYFEDYFNGLTSDSLDIQFNNTSDISKNAQRLHDAMNYMQKFYNEKGLSIDFSPSTDYITVDSTYEIELGEDNNIEVIGEEHTVVE